MLLVKILSIFLLNFVIVISGFLEARSNFMKPRLERNNIVNKRIWVKGSHSNEKSITPGHFIFRPNSVDVEAFENNIEQFDGSSVQSFSLFPSYVDRSKRSDERVPRHKREAKKDTMKKPSEDALHTDKNELKRTETLALLHFPYAKFITYDDPPASSAPTFEDIKNKENLTKTYGEKSDVKIYEGKYSNNSTESVDLSNDNRTSLPINLSDILASERNNELANKSDSHGGKYERDVIDKLNMWQHAAVDSNSYYNAKSNVNVSPKTKPMTERGLVKILSLLAKFFQKMSRQHEDVKNLHKKLVSLNDDFVQNIDVMTNKLHNFDIKYLFLLKLNENIKQIEAKIKAKEKDFETKKNELSKYVKELEMEQKKFLVQQQQFYNVQKLLLMQNEKITSKQNMIARTQVEISRRQNNFARLLKKSKHVFTNTPKERPTTEEPVSSFSRPTTKASTTTTTTTTTSTSKSVPINTRPVATMEPIKINLFSITPMKGLENNDEQILKEKDEKSVDDLIYKYYFNNTFIDNLIKKKILADFLVSENNEIIPNIKNKRNGKNNIKKTTILLPLPNKRQKRWIRHHASGSRKRNRGKTTTVPIKDDVKIVNLRTKHSVDIVPPSNYPTPFNFVPPKPDPFRIMATNFCKEIGQNNTDQSLKWCIEKALRKLKFMNAKFPLPEKTGSPIAVKLSKAGINPITPKQNVPSPSASLSTSPTTPTSMTTPMTTQAATSFTALPTIYFPDNDKLETYLEQFELKPDPEGTVYFEGSVHADDLDDGAKSDGVSDIMPEIDDHDVLPLNPRTLNFEQAHKLGYNIHNLNPKLLKKLTRH